MTGRWRGAAAFATAAALFAPSGALLAEPVLPGVRVVLCLTAGPGDEAWIAGLEAALNDPPGPEPLLVVPRAMPGVDEGFLGTLAEAFAPVAVVSRRPVSRTSVNALRSRGLPVLQYPSTSADAAEAAREVRGVLRDVSAQAASAPRPSGAFLLAAAKAHLDYGDDRAAERALEKVLAGSAQDVEALRGLVLLRRRELRYWPAIDAAERWAQVPGLPAPRRAEALLAAADLRALVGDAAGSARGYRSALKLVPGDRAALAGLAQVLRERPEEALRHVALAAKGGGAPTSALRLAAEIHYDLGDFAAARRDLEGALAADPSDLETLALLVSVEKESPARAAAYASMAAAVAESQPLWRRPDAYRLAARLWRELGDRERADALYLAAAAVDPDHIETLEDLLSLRRENAGGPEAAPLRPWAADLADPEVPEQEVLRALDADGGDLDALGRLIAVRAAQGRLREASTLIRRFLSAVPDAPLWTRRAAYRLIARLAWDCGDPLPAWLAMKVSDPGEPWALEEVRLRMRSPGGGLGFEASEVSVAAARAALGDIPGGERRLKRVLDAFPQDRRALYELFHLKASDSRYAEALALFPRVEAAWSEAPARDRAELLEKKAAAQIGAGDEAGAEKTLERAYRIAETPGILDMLRDLTMKRVLRGKAAR